MLQPAAEMLWQCHGPMIGFRLRFFILFFKLASLAVAVKHPPSEGSTVQQSSRPTAGCSRHPPCQTEELDSMSTATSSLALTRAGDGDGRVKWAGWPSLWLGKEGWTEIDF